MFRCHRLPQTDGQDHGSQETSGPDVHRGAQQEVGCCCCCCCYVVVTGVEQPGVVPQPQGGHHHMGEDRAAALRGQEVRSLPLTDEEDGEKVTWTLCSADYKQLVLPRFLSRHTKKKYVNSLENKQRKYTGM